MTERAFEQTLQKQERYNASAARLKSHLAKVASEGAPADLIVKIGRKTAYCEDLSKRLGEQAISEEADFYVSRYVSQGEQPQPLVGVVLPLVPKADDRKRAKIEPQTLAKPKPSEYHPIEEEPKLPKIVIDGRVSTVSVDGREPIRLNKGYIRLLKNLAKSGDKGLESSQVVTAFSMRKDAPVASVGSQIIHNLRVKIEADPRTPRVILREGARYKPIYKLNGELSFTNETAETIRGRESRNVYEVTLPDRTLIPVMGKLRAKLANRLIQASQENPVSTADLSKAVYGSAKRASKLKLLSQISSLRTYLDQYSWEVRPVYGLYKGKGKLASYYLESTKEQSEETKLSLTDIEVMQSRQDALNLLITDPNVEIEEIIKTLGPAKNDRDLTRPQALFALNRAVNLLYVRVRDKKATDQEIKLWKSIQEGTKKEDPKDSLDAFKAGMKAWFSESKSVTREDLGTLVREHESKIDRLTGDEAGIVAALILNRNGTRLNIYTDGKPEVFEIEEDVQDILRDLISNVSFKDQGDISEEKREEYIKMRTDALNKVERILKADNAVDLIEAHEDENTQLFLMALYMKDEEVAGLVCEFLKDAPDQYLQVERWRFSQVWREWTPEKRLERQKASSSAAESVVIPMTEPETPAVSESTMGAVSSSDLAGFGESQSDLFQPGKKEIQISEAEAAIFAEAVSKIQVESSGATSLTQAQVSRTFHYMTRDTLKQAISNGHLSPKREGLRNIYAQEDIIFLHALKSLGNHLSKNERKQLRKKVKKYLADSSQ